MGIIGRFCMPVTMSDMVFLFIFISSGRLQGYPGTRINHSRMGATQT